jgi:hypothetical protein
MAVLVLTHRTLHPNCHPALGPRMTDNDLWLLRCWLTLTHGLSHLYASRIAYRVAYRIDYKPSHK